MEIIKKKWLKDTLLTVLLIAIIFAIYFLINWGVEKINIEDIDLTSDKIYSISEATRTKLKDLDKDVQIQLINLKDYTYLNDFTNKYTQLNSHISVEKIEDISARADLINEYQLEQTDSLIVIKSGDRKTELTTSDLYTYDYTTYEQIDITEEAITNAIIEVTIEDKPKVYYLTGHENLNVGYFQLFLQEVEKEANEVDTLNILTAGSVPEDCDCLIITTVKTDFTEMEKEKLIEYANKGGKILLLADSNVLGNETPNFDAFLDLYGFTISKGVILEQDNSKMVYGSPEFVISEIEGVINQNVKMNMSICAIDTGRVEFKDEEALSNLGITYTTIAKTSNSAFLRTNLSLQSLEKTKQDEDAPESIIGALVTRKLEDGKTSEMIVYANSMFATNQQVSMSGSYPIYANRLCNNDDVAINSIAYLTQRTDTITIRKNSDSITYTPTQTQHNIVVAIIFLVPVAIIVLGIVIWQVRRRKK